MKATRKILLLAIFISAPLLAVRATGNTIGINEINIKRISIGIINLNLPDDDKDGLDNELEKALGTNSRLPDSDGDGYSDKVELDNDYDPLGKGRLNIDKNLASRLANKYLLRVEKRGELWYLNPKDRKRYLAGNATRKKSLLDALSVTAEPKPTAETDLLGLLATKIRANDKAAVASLVNDNYKNRVSSAMDTLTAEQKLAWANILSGAKLSSQTATEKIYTAEVYFSLGGKNVTVEYRTTKQTDGGWLISKL